MPSDQSTAHRPGTGLADGFSGERIQTIPAPTVQRALSTPFTRSAITTDAGYFPKAKQHFRERPYGITEVIVVACTQGSGWVEINGVRHAVAARQLAIIPPGTPHSYGSSEDTPWTIWWCHVAGDLVPSLLSYFPDAPLTPVVPLRRADLVQSRISDIVDALESDSARLLLERNTGLTTALLGDLIADRKHPEKGEPLDLTMAYLRDHVETNPSVPELAHMVGLSSSHLTTLFRNSTGSGVLAYHTSLKMERARQLLDTTNQSIAKIAGAVGYRDQFYFSRHFKSAHGVSPSLFRKRNQG